MNNESIIPQSKWQAIPQRKNQEFVAGDANRAFLSIADGYIAAYAVPKLLIPAGENRLIISCENQRMYCINTTTGEVIWTIKETGSYDAYGDFKHTCYHNGVVYTGITDTYFTAIDPATGQYLWQINCGRKKHSFSSPFFFRDNNAYISSGDTVFCIDLSTRKVVWKTPIAPKESIFRRMPVVWKNYLVYHASNTDKHFSQENYSKKYKLYFVNMDTGGIETAWDLKYGPREWNFPMHVTGDTLWYISFDDYLCRCDLETGKAGQLKFGDYYTIFGECFMLHNNKLYTGMRVDEEMGLFSYDTSTQELKKVFDEKEFDETLRSIKWIKVGDFLYGYYDENFEDKLVYSLSLSDLTLKKYAGVPKTGNEALDEMFNPIAGFAVDNGVCYVSTQFEDGDDENARICLWAFWQ